MNQSHPRTCCIDSTYSYDIESIANGLLRICVCICVWVCVYVCVCVSDYAKCLWSWLLYIFSKCRLLFIMSVELTFREARHFSKVILQRKCRADFWEMFIFSVELTFVEQTFEKCRAFYIASLAAQPNFTRKILKNTNWLCRVVVELNFENFPLLRQHMSLSMAHHWLPDFTMGCLRLVGSLKSQVSFAEHSLFYRALL